MSPTEIQITPPRTVSVQVIKAPDINIQVIKEPIIGVIAAGNIGPPGPAGKWEAMTQSEYDLLTPPDPNTLYVIIQ